MHPAFVLLALMIALSIGLVSLGVYRSRTDRHVQARLVQYGSRASNLTELELERGFSERIIKPAFGALTRKLASMAPQKTLERAKQQLELAGSPARLRAVDFIGLRVLCGLGLGGVVFVGGQAASLGLGGALLMGVLMGTLGFMLPVMWLGSRISQRKQAILRSLPDALDLLTISVEAGLGFDAALAKVTEKWDNALTQEFSRALAEIRVGRLRREALRDMAERTDVPELKSFVAAVIQADQLGASIGRILHVQAAQMRMKRRQRAEELAQKAPIKMLIPLVFLIMPALFIVLLGPAVISVKTSGVLSII